MIEKLNPEVAIDILEKAKAFLEAEKYPTGLCYVIKEMLRGYYVNSKPTMWVDYCHLHEYIPQFTFENAHKLSEKYGFQKPKDEHLNDVGYWWKVGCVKSRTDFIDAMIKELEQEIV